MNEFIILAIYLVLALLNAPAAMKGSKINFVGIGFCLGMGASHLLAMIGG